MKRFLSSLLAPFTKARTAAAPKASLHVECLEAREMMTAAPMTPANFVATGVSASQIKLTWTPVSGATNYQIDYRINGGAWNVLSTNTTGGQSSLTLTCTAGALYGFDICAHNSAGWSGWAPAQNAITLYNPTASVGYAMPPSNSVLFTSSGPAPTDVTQGAAGDCWYIASLAAVAARSPQSVRNMFTYEGTTVENGVNVPLYMVRFFTSSGQADYVTVDTKLPQGGNYYDHVTNALTGQNILWVALAEKAYAEANGLGYITTANAHSDSYAGLNGGDPAKALQSITGKQAYDYSFVAGNLASDWNAGYPIVITSDAGSGANLYVDPNNPYIVGDHAYAVVGYNGSSFQVLNPWGTYSNGTAPSKGYNGQYVWGETWFSPAFLAANFSSVALGSYAEPVAHAADVSSTPSADLIAKPVSTVTVAERVHEPAFVWETPAINAHLTGDLDDLDLGGFAA
jgi:hypothetical protein